MYTRFVERSNILDGREHFGGPSRGPAILIGNIVPMVVATIFTFARIWSRMVVLRIWGPDDIFLIISWVFALALIVANCVGVHFGLGHHSVDIPMSENIPIGLIQYSTRFFYLLALSTNKISVCLFCLKIFGDGRSRWLVIGTIGVVTAYTIPIFFLSTFTCYPIRKSWDPMVQGKCIDTLPIFYTLVVVNIVIDVWLIVLIARKVGQLHLPRKQKTLLLLIVTMGWIGVVAALFRAIRVTAIVHQVELGRDAPWIAFDTSIWSAVEVCVGLFCVSAPTIKPFIRQCMPHILTTLKSTFSRNYRETKTSPSHPLQSQKSGPRHNENSLEFSESPSLLREERSQGEHLLRDRDMG